MKTPHLTCAAATVTKCGNSGPGQEGLLAATATRDQVIREPRRETLAVLSLSRLAQPQLAGSNRGSRPRLLEGTRPFAEEERELVDDYDR